MKTINNTVRKVKKVALILFLSMMTSVGFAQDPPPPPGEDGGGNSANQDNQLGGSAHVGGGVLILLSLAIAYGGRRIYQLKKEEK